MMSNLCLWMKPYEKINFWFTKTAYPYFLSNRLRSHSFSSRERVVNDEDLAVYSVLKVTCNDYDESYDRAGFWLGEPDEYPIFGLGDPKAWLTVNLAKKYLDNLNGITFEDAVSVYATFSQPALVTTKYR